MSADVAAGNGQADGLFAFAPQLVESQHIPIQLQ